MPNERFVGCRVSLWGTRMYTHLLKECLAGKGLGSRLGSVFDSLALIVHL